MKTFYEIMEEKDLNNLTPLEYAIWFLESATGASGAQQAAQDLARITAERARYRYDLARAIALIDEQVSFSEADKFAGTTLFETWQEVQAALKQSS